MNHNFVNRVHGAARGLVATVLGTGALGMSKDPEYLKEVLPQAPLYGNVAPGALEAIGNFAAQHQNPTVAFLGLGAISIAVNRGPLLALPGCIRRRMGMAPALSLENLIADGVQSGMRLTIARMPNTTGLEVAGQQNNSIGALGALAAPEPADNAYGGTIQEGHES